MYVFVAFQRASRKIGSPIELPSLNKDFTYLLTYLVVKRWPTDLVVPSSRPAVGEILPSVNGVPLHKAFHYHRFIVLI